MATYLAPLEIPLERQRSARAAHPARWLRRHLDKSADRKIALLAGVPTFERCTRTDLIALAAAADVIEADPDLVLAEGSEVRHQWFMPLSGWLLLAGTSKPALTIPAGRSWTVGSDPVERGVRLSALRGGSVLVATTPRLYSLIGSRPRLGTAIRSSMVSADV